MRIYVFILMLAFATSGWPQPPQDSKLEQANNHFNGKWWLSADTDERSGFITGASDCLTWAAHEKGFDSLPEEVVDGITSFYEAHPEAVRVPIVDVWKMVPRKAPKTPKVQGGEIWKNAHWYLNGDWWGGITLLEAKGYLKGYIWCMNNRIHPKTDTYSQPVSFYQRKIDAYIKAHPKSGAEAVAVILSRFRDKPSRTKPE